MEFRVLGPLEVVHDGDASAPPGGKERTILARLLLEPARVVSTDALLEAAWPETDPETAARSLAVRLANLRAYLEPDRPSGAPSIHYDEERSEAASQRTSLMALAAVLAERGQLEPAAVLLGATEDWPAAPYLAAFAARALDLEGAKALARAAI